MSSAQGIFQTSSSSSKRGRKEIEMEREEIVENKVVVCVVENRAREVCIAKLSSSNCSILEIYLITDSHSYYETIATLQVN